MPRSVDFGVYNYKDGRANKMALKIIIFPLNYFAQVLAEVIQEGDARGGFF